MKIEVLEMKKEKTVEVVEKEIGDPGVGEVQIEIKACGICAWDTSLFKGRSLVSDFPFQFGHEGVGIIKKVGSGVEKFKVGDKVFGAGGANMMAQMINIPVEYITHIPSDVKDFSLWVGEPVVCVVNGFEQINLMAGDDIAIVGTGYMGLLNIQGLANSLIGKLYAFDIDDERLKLAKKFGADEIYNLNTEEGKKKVEALSESGGLDVVFEVSGAEEGFKTANKLIKEGGKMSMFAWHRGERNFDGTKWHLGGYKIINTSPSSNEHYTDMIPRAGRLMNKNIFYQDSLITHKMNYKNAQEILEIANNKSDGYIKGVVTF